MKTENWYVSEFDMFDVFIRNLILHHVVNLKFCVHNFYPYHSLQRKRHVIADLPFRSIDIDVSSLLSETLVRTVSADKGGTIDRLNNANDPSFQPFQEMLDSGSTSEERTSMQEESKVDPDNMKSEKRLIIACYHLPVKLTKDEATGEYTAIFKESLIAKTKKSSVTETLETFWVGTVSLKATSEEEKQKIREVLALMNCWPLFLDDDTIDSFYYGMCKQVLWPTFHNIDLLDIAKSGWGKNNLLQNEVMSEADSNWDQSRLDAWWNSFCAVNKAFANAIMTCVRQNDVIWVHDYHLSLLPKFLHEAEEALIGRRTLQMIFFLHIPFPTSQVFRELERGEQILEGMLHADVVGFHAFDHARHFLNASKRILGLSHESLVGGLIGVRYRGTKVLVTINNVSIESDVLETALNSQEVQDEANRLKLKHKGRTIIAGVDIAQGLSGVSLKLLAFERLLADYPIWRDKVVLIQTCLIPSSRKCDETDTLTHVRYLVQRIQKTFGSDLIAYEEVVGSGLSRKDRLPLLLASEVFMSTPIREGLNLLPLEFVFARKSMTPGVTITSEFSAVCSILNGALRVNPYDIQMATTSIDKALAMSMEEKVSRRERDIGFVSSSCSGQWTRRVLADLNDVTEAAIRENEESPMTRGPALKMDSIASTTDANMSATLLDPIAVMDAYNSAKKRVIFVDFNGTIVMKEPTGKYLKREMLGTAANKPPVETMKALSKLCADERNTVYVVSGDTENNIENALGRIQGLGLASGNGGSLLHPTHNADSSRWQTSDLGVDWDSVKEIALPIVSKYTARANGSYIKMTSSSIGWSHYSCDPEWANLLATSLVEELKNELHHFDIRLVVLKGVIEVVPRKLNKGLVVKEVLGKDSLPDFIFCCGDDVSDEKMYSAVFSVVARACAVSGDEEANVPNHVFTCTVGRKDSNASYFVESAEDVADLLVKVSGEEYSSGRAMSWDSNDNGLDMFDA